MLGAPQFSRVWIRPGLIEGFRSIQDSDWRTKLDSMGIPAGRSRTIQDCRSGLERELRLARGARGDAGRAQVVQDGHKQQVENECTRRLSACPLLPWVGQRQRPQGTPRLSTRPTPNSTTSAKIVTPANMLEALPMQLMSSHDAPDAFRR